MRSIIRQVCFGVSALPLLWAASVSAHEGHHDHVGPFLYDHAHEMVTASMLGESEWYDPSIAVREGEVWVAWLEFTPNEGDAIWVGRREGDGWVHRERVTAEPGRYAKPTLTADTEGRLWLSYEVQDEESQQWDVRLRPAVGEGPEKSSLRISRGQGSDINHAVAADPEGGLWVVWQADREGQFDVMGRHVRDGEAEGEARVLSDSPRGDWRPRVAVTPTGDVAVVWDGYDGKSFNVLSRRRIDDGWEPIRAVASGPAFQGRADVGCDRDGRTWVLWEEGGENWGKTFRGGPEGFWTNITDTYGPMHRFRTLHIGLLQEDGGVRRLANPLPMPSQETAPDRPNKRDGVEMLGAFYERGKLIVDGDGGLWVLYRHFYQPQVGADEATEHHIEQGWRLYARRIQDEGWSDLYAFDIHQRDGIQRLSVAPRGGGLTAVWATGRTDRHEDPEPRGVAIATLRHPGGSPSQPELTEARLADAHSPDPSPDAPEPAEVGGETYHLFFGDLHRHTDLSLCFPFYDGSLDDAYRYAVEAAGLDFLGVTDHTRDIDRGDALSQLWWRSTKEVTRHRLTGTFFPYFAYERSRGSTDHNVISLRDDMLAPYRPPLPEFWDQIRDYDTFTIPHAHIRERTWEQQDDAKRPLVEVYQGYRDLVSLDLILPALEKGYHLGFISSSDHLSTAASFACVWSPEAGREPIFRSMQARRTYGATDKIRLVFRSGDHWMGERFTADSTPTFQIELDGTASIQSVDIYRDGKRVGQLPVPGDEKSLRATWKPDEDETGDHYFYIHMKQTDGNQAWSSPIWVEGRE